MLRRVLVCVALAVASAVGASVAVGCSSDSAGSNGSDAGVDASSDATASHDTAPMPDASNDSAPDQGSGVVVSCDNLCDSIIAHCVAGDIEYTSKAACMSTCMGVPLGAYADMIDSVGCRQEQADEGRNMPTPQCEVAGPFGGGRCGDRCASYCRVIATSCTGANVVYATTAACTAECGSAYKFDGDAGFEYTSSGNTLNCREKQLLTLANDSSMAATICPLLKATSTACHN